LLAWEIWRLFRKLSGTYNLQIKAVKRWGDECYAREQWLNTTLHSIGDAVIACDPDGKVVFMNGVAQELTGWKEAEADGIPLSQVFAIYNERTRAVIESPVDVVRRLGKIVGLANHTILVSKDGREPWRELEHDWHRSRLPRHQRPADLRGCAYARGKIGIGRTPGCGDRP
jgi:PAS domain S-box-containing protein